MDDGYSHDEINLKIWYYFQRMIREIRLQTVSTTSQAYKLIFSIKKHVLHVEAIRGLEVAISLDGLTLILNKKLGHN
jgi:hypothetical protein